MEKVVVSVRSKKKIDFENGDDKICGVQVFYEEKTDDKNVVGPLVKKEFISCRDSKELDEVFNNTCKKIPANYELVFKPVSTSKGHKLKIVDFVEAKKF